MAVATPATLVLNAHKIAYTTHAYDHTGVTDGYGADAAAALGVDTRRIFKTLITTVDGSLVCAVVPVAGHLDLKALARAAHGKKAAMADVAAAQRATGYVIGGISPLGQRSRLRVFLDSSATQHETVFVSAGRRGVQVELAPDDLRRVADAVTAPIAGD